jgi:hypothetical protein
VDLDAVIADLEEDDNLLAGAVFLDGEKQRAGNVMFTRLPELDTLRRLCECYRQFVAGIVPEDFIWHGLASVTDALAYLYYGFRTAGEMLAARKGTYGAGPHDYGWVPTAHRAVHMDRIYLTAEGTAGLANQYPRILLGDFNKCIRKVAARRCI